MNNLQSKIDLLPDLPGPDKKDPDKYDETQVPDIEQGPKAVA